MYATFTHSTYIHYSLIGREYFSKQIDRSSYRILRKLIVKGDFNFSKKCSLSSQQRISSDGILLFLKNYTQCFDCLAPQPSTKFKMKKSSLSKIEDALILAGCPDTFELPMKGYKRCMLAVTKNNRLLRVDTETGQVLEEIFISALPIHYKYIQWNESGKSVVLSSTVCPRNRNNEVKQVTVLSVFPLAFVAKFSISHQVFGKSAADLLMFFNLVVVMFSDGYVRMYSLDWILNRHRTHHHQLYDNLDDGSKFGIFPSPLTDNVCIDELPPCLFEVRCKYRDLMMTMPPCYYIVWPYNEKDGYCCFCLETQQKVECAYLSKPHEVLEHDNSVAIHSDDSARIIHMTSNQLRMLKVVTNEKTQRPKLTEDFVITQQAQDKDENKLRVSMSGRILKKRILMDVEEFPEKTILTMAYSEDQDLIIVLSVRPTVDTNAIIGFYDNWSGRLLRQFELEDSVEEVDERFLTFYLDTLVHVFKDRKGFTANIYKLKSLTDT